MLRNEKNVDKRSLRGKKYRHPLFWGFLMAIFVSLAVMVLLILLAGPDVEGILAGLILVVAFTIAMLALRRALCVLGEDRLYFFGCTVKRYRDEKGICFRSSCMDGSVSYADIRRIERITAKEAKARFGVAAGSVVMLYGDAFEIRISGGKAFAERLEKRSRFVLPTEGEPVMAEEAVAATGLFREAVERFEGEGFGSFFGEDVVLESGEFDSDVPYLAFLLRMGEVRLDLGLDDATVSFYFPEVSLAEADKTVSIGEFADMNAWLACVRSCLETGELPPYREVVPMGEETTMPASAHNPLQRTDVPLKELAGKRIRRQYFNIPCYASFLLAFFVFGVIKGEELLRGTGNPAMLIPHFFSMLGIWLAVASPLILLAVLNRLFFGKLICVLNTDGLHFSGGCIAWKDITRMEYHIGSASRYGNSTPCRVTVYCGDRHIDINSAPLLLFREAKKFCPKLQTKWDKSIFLYVLIPPVVIALFAFLEENASAQAAWLC